MVAVQCGIMFVYIKCFFKNCHNFNMQQPDQLQTAKRKLAKFQMILEFLSFEIEFNCKNSYLIIV